MPTYTCTCDGENSEEQQRTRSTLHHHHDDFAVVDVVAACDFAKSKWYSVIFGIATNDSYCSSYPAADDGQNSAQTE
jgi:hypothetical protein